MNNIGIISATIITAGAFYREYFNETAYQSSFTWEKTAYESLRWASHHIFETSGNHLKRLFKTDFNPPLPLCCICTSMLSVTDILPWVAHRDTACVKSHITSNILWIHTNSAWQFNCKKKLKYNCVSSIILGKVLYHAVQWRGMANWHRDSNGS